MTDHAYHVREYSRQIKVVGVDFNYKMTCIDLDPKKMTLVPKYLKKDGEIVSYYLAKVGDREPSCDSRLRSWERDARK